MAVGNASRITLAGQDITAYVQAESVQFDSVLGSGPGVPSGGGRAATCQMDVRLGPANTAYGAGQTLPASGGPFLVRQGQLVITDLNGNVVFGGFVTKLDDITEKVMPKTTIYGVDYWQNLDRIMVNVVYNGVSDVSVISALMSAYAPGVNTSLVNLTTANYVFPKLFLRAKTLQEALKKVAQTTGFDVWVDANNSLRYQAPTSEGTAAFAISDTPNGVSSFPAKFTKVEVDDNAIINRVTFYGGKTPTASDFTQDISSQANGTNTTFVLAYYPHESSNGKVQVTVNGVQQVVGYVFSSGAGNTLKSQGGLADLLLNRDAQALQFDVAPASGASVKAIYRYYTPLLVQITSPQSYAFYGNYYDGKISDETVFDISTAILRCRTLLAQQEYGLVSIEFTLTNHPGLVAGTQIRIDNRARGLHNTYVIQEVKAQGIGNGAYSYDVTVGAWSWQLADLLLANARSQATEDLQSEAETTVIQVETTLVTITTSFVVTTETRTSGGYYARTAPLGDGHDAYAGLFTITS